MVFLVVFAELMLARQWPELFAVLQRDGLVVVDSLAAAAPAAGGRL